MPKESSPGWVYSPIFQMYVPATHLAGTSQIIYLDSLVLGYKCAIEAVTFVQDIALVGASGSQTINVRKGGTSGDVLVDLAILIADSGIGTVSRATVDAADQDTAYLRSDSDTLSIEMAASGTAFSAGEGTLTVWGRTRPQAAN